MIDFGFAVFEHAKEKEHIPYGTARYIAPEVLQGKGIFIGSDIYFCGITLYEMLTGMEPFDDGDEQKILKIQVSSPAPRAPLDEAQVPAEIQSVVLKSLEKDPEKRYRSIQAMKDDFLNAVGRAKRKK